MAITLGSLSGVAISVIACLVGVIFYFWLVKNLLPFGLIPQECELIEISLAGQVEATNGMTVSGAKITVTDNFPIYGSPVKLILMTDTNGRFEKNKISIFRCEKFLITASANGYLPKHGEYYINPDIIREGSLPKNLVFTLEETR